MTENTVAVPIVCFDGNSELVIESLNKLVIQSKLPICFETTLQNQKSTQKVLSKLSADFAKPIFIIDSKGQFSLLVEGIRVHPDWQSLQRRVVSAGRKTELILKACKLTESSRVLDATAGFGHDSLILGSTGAQITMLERNPLMALLLLYEKQVMSQEMNWLKLMQRLDIICQDAAEYLDNTVCLQNKENSQHKENLHHKDSLEVFAGQKTTRDVKSAELLSLGLLSANQNQTYDDSYDNDESYDVIYLDPMFPENSYDNAQTGKGAKVGKHMQALHNLANPPNIQEEQQLLSLALDKVAIGGRVIVKRPVYAPVFAKKKATESWQNDVVRFDAYFK